MNTALLTILALLAFAGNSVLCRLALGADLIDAGSFTAIRLISGAAVLVAISQLMAKTSTATGTSEVSSTEAVTETASGSWRAAVLLFVYAITFSFAYNTLDTGTGALILFAAVQITILLSSYFTGTKLQPVEWVGVMTAFAGFVYLVLPSVSTPSLTGFVLMSVSGIAWGFYTLAGKGSANPLADTQHNFTRTLPLVLVLIVIIAESAALSLRGVIFAVVAGAITSGVGYAIWYRALADISSVQAAVVQLLVPGLAALGGVVFADDVITARLVIASVLIIFGILIVILGKQYMSTRSSDC